MLRKLYLIRHGQTEWNLEERMQGRLDSGLTDLGRRQADEHGRLLRRAGVQRLLASPLGRTTETAYIVNSYVHANIEFEEALVERHCGTWAGQTITDIKMSQPLAWQARQQDPWEHRPPGGENLPDVMARIEPLVSGLLTAECETVAVISHGIVGRAILAHYLGLSSTDAVTVRQPNDVAYALEFTAENRSVHCEYFRRGEGPLNGMCRTA